MKISVLADCHLGFGYNTELENDSFDNFEEALDKSLDCDLILIAGDLFDSRSPRTTVWARAISALTKPLLEKSGIVLVGTTKNLNGVHSRTLESVPVICLHGNHDRRMRNEINAVQALDAAGMLLHLHKENVVFEKDGMKLAIHGMSSVPERFAKANLQEWNPKPVAGAFNILVIHQNVDPYVYSPLEPPSIRLEDLPSGFDLILDGHIHTKVIDKAGETPFIVLGSTVTTQFEKKEAGSNKGFHKITLQSGARPEIQSVPLEGNRRFFYYEVSADNLEVMRNEIGGILTEIAGSNLKKAPVVKFKIFGKDTRPVDQDIAMMQRKYSDNMILSFAKQLDSEEMAEKLEFMRNLREQKLSVEEIGLSLLRKNLESMKFAPGFNYEEMFSMLSENAVDKAMALLTGDQKTLYQMAGVSR